LIIRVLGPISRTPEAVESMNERKPGH